MIDAFLHLLVIATAIYGIFRGYRSGFTGQVASILGIAFGAVASHAFGNEMAQRLAQSWSALHTLPGASFMESLLGHLIIFIAGYGILAFVGLMLQKIMNLFFVDIINATAGAIFCAFKYLFVLSLVYNMIAGLFPRSILMKYADADDGNLVRIVMLIGPGVMGDLDCDDLHHIIQLHDAKSIS